MPSQQDRYRKKLHNAFNHVEFPTCVFRNYTQSGIEDGQPTGSYSEIGTLDCEFVPPAADSTVDTEGTHLDFSTSIRVPTSDLDSLLPDRTLTDDLTVADGETESFDALTIQAGVTLTIQSGGTVIANTLTNNGTIDIDGTLSVVSELSGEQVPYGVDGERPTRVGAQGTTYEVQSVVPEHGSDMRLIRLTEV